MIRAAIAQWKSAADHTSGPKPDGQLGAIIEVMLGTSARIGEVLAAASIELASELLGHTDTGSRCSTTSNAARW